MSDLTAESLRPLAVASGYQELLDALRARKSELGLSDAMIDMLSGLAAGHTGKLLGPAQVKILGPVSMGVMLQTLGLVLIVAEDPEQTAKMRGRYVEREGGQVRDNNHASHVSTGMMRRVFKHISKKGGRARWRGVSKKDRSAAMSRAAKARWVKPRRARTERP